MLTEFDKGLMITESLLKRDEHGNKIYPELTWKRLFKKFNFFKAYLHFIQIQILSESEEVHEKWLGYSESKIRKLLNHLEKLNELKGGCMEFRPYPRSYRLHNEVYKHNDSYYFGIRIKKNDNMTQMRIDLSGTIKIFYEKLKEWVSADKNLEKMVIQK